MGVAIPRRKEFILADGSRVCYRAVQRADAPLLQAFHHDLSPQTRYRAFHGFVLTLSDARAHRLACVDGIHRFALVAEDPVRPDALLAVARYEGEVDSDRAELALVVADRVQNRGLGFALLQRLVGAARRGGIRVAHGIVMADNRPMLRLLQKLALPQRVEIDHGCLTVEMDLGVGPCTCT